MADKDMPALTSVDVERIGAVLRSIEHTAGWAGSKDYFEVWLIEQRIAAERASTNRLARATWLLVGVTAALVLATVALVIATLTA